MALPPNLNVLDFSGKFTMNSSISDTTMDEILRLQGVGWLKRKAITMGTVTLFIKHFKDADGVEHVDIDQTLTGGFAGTSEKRLLTWSPREHSDHVFGAVVSKSRRVQIKDLEEVYLASGWEEHTLEHGVVQSYTESDTPKSRTTWIANQTWGVEVVNDERRYSRHIQFTGPGGEDIKCRLVYDYLGPVE